MIDCTCTEHRCTRLNRGISLVLFAVGIWLSPTANGQAPANGKDLPLITRAADVLRFEGPARDKRYRFSVDATVSYYDPLYFQFYGVDVHGTGTDNTFYLAPTTNRRLPIKPGQLVRLTGEVVPTAGFRAEKLEVQILAEAEPSAVISARGRLGDHAALNARVVDLEGLVDWQEQLDTNHQRLSLVSEGYKLNTTLWLNEKGQAPLLAGAIVHALGMYLPRVDINDRLVSIELRVQGAENIGILRWLNQDPRFDQPTSRISDVLSVLPGTRVHIIGKVDSFRPGRTVTIHDGSGVMELRTPQERGLHVGAEIDAIGHRSSGAGDVYIDQALWRLHGDSVIQSAKTTEASPLSLAAQVLELPLEKAAAQQPVKLSGVVTWGSEGYRSFYLQDRSGGVRVTVDPKVEFPGNPTGLGIEVSGVSAMGEFAPEVIARQVRVGAVKSPPEPQQVTLEQARTAAIESRWVEMEGFVRAVEATKLWTQLDLTTPTGEFRAMLPLDANATDKVGAFVRLQGVCTASANESSGAVGVQLWVPSGEHIDVDEAPLSDPFSIPFTPLESLGRFGSEQSVARRLHTAGTVTYQAPGRYFVIQSGSARLQALSSEKTILVPGDQVDVVGIPGWNATRFVLRESIVRKSGHDQEPAPIQLPTPIRLAGLYDFRLVQLSGLLTDITAVGDESFLSVRNADDNIIARISNRPGSGQPASWRKGSKVKATGVYRLRYDENRKVAGVDLLLRTPADLTITSSPPWWTIERALAAAGLLGVCAAGITLWVVSLRRRVNTQTEHIRQQLEKQTKLEAELERAQRLRSLGLLAGGIAHDFNNLLTVIMGNLTLAMLDEVVVARTGDLLREMKEGAKRAQGLTQQLLTFAKGGDPVREVFSLPAVVDDAASLALSGAKSRMAFNPPAGLWPVYADRAQIARAVENLVAFANVAMPEGGVIGLTAANDLVAADAQRLLAPGRYVLLTISDKGPGIPAERLTGIFDPYAAAELGKEQFGLATTYSIMKKHGGLIDVESRVGLGTTFRLWIPAAESVAADTPTTGS